MQLVVSIIYFGAIFCLLLLLLPALKFHKACKFINTYNSIQLHYNNANNYNKHNHNLCYPVDPFLNKHYSSNNHNNGTTLSE